MLKLSEAGREPAAETTSYLFPRQPFGEPTCESGLHALAAAEAMSRRIDVLARQLNCLGYFSDEDRPKAA